MSFPLSPATPAPIPWHALEGYVFSHFWQAYEPGPTVHFGCGGRYPDSAVHIIGTGESFFAGTAVYPPTPSWREWQGRQIPFFFDANPDGPLLTLTPGRAEIHVDLLAAAFYLLSGWQEYFSDERDQHGRFPYAASVQYRYGFVAVPVVNYYFDIFKTAVEHVTGKPLHSRRWANNAPFATFVTHDVDSLRSAWKAPAKAAVQRGAWWQFGKQIWRRFFQKDAWDNLELVQQTVVEHGAKSTFFLLPQHRHASSGTPNADHKLTASTLRRRFKALVKEGAELAVHGSIGTSVDVQQLKREQTRISVPTSGNRFHYLSWEPRRTPLVVEEAGFSYDSTLGFAEHFGFRNSYCLPFHPFDFTRGYTCRFLEIPLNVMDATLHHPNYLQLAPEQILPALQPMFQEIERFGGVCTLLWHNDHFDPANETTGPRQFAELMHYLRRRNTTFVNGTDILLRHETVRSEK